MGGYMPKAITDVWSSPKDLVENLREEFCGFDLDPCADTFNAVSHRFYTKECNGLDLPYFAETVYMNPPYGRDLLLWITKALDECYLYKHCETVVMLLPVRSDTRWFHLLFERGFDEIRFIKGRLKYGEGKSPAPFPSMIVVLNQHNQRRIVSACNKQGVLM